MGKGNSGILIGQRRIPPVYFPAVEGLGVERHGRRVPGLGAADADLSSELHPRDGEDGPRVGAGQCEDVFLAVFQEPQHTSRERGGQSGKRRREGGHRMGNGRRSCGTP